MSDFDERSSSGTALLTPPEEQVVEQTTWPDVDRRSSYDRRHAPTRFWGELFGPRRRSCGRRAGEDHNITVDVFTWRDVLLADPHVRSTSPDADELIAAYTYYREVLKKAALAGIEVAVAKGD